MSTSYSSLFSKAQQLYREGLYAEVDVQLSNLEKLTEITEEENKKISLLKLKNLIKQKKNEKALNYADSLISNYTDKDTELEKVKVMLHIIEVQMNLREWEESTIIIISAEKTLTKYSKSQEDDVLDLNARLEYVKGWEFLGKNLYDRALDHLEKSLEMYRELGDKYKIALAMRLIATNLFYLGEFESSRNFYDTCLEIFKSYKSRMEIASVYFGIAGIHYRRGELNQALEIASKSLAIREQTDDQYEIAGSVQGIAYIYSHMGDLDKGLEYLRRCKMIYEKLGFKHDVAKCLMDIHGNFRQKGEYDRALATIFDYYSLKKELNDERCVGIAYGYIGTIYEIKGEFDEAIINYQKALKMLTNFDVVDSISDVHYNLGNILHKKGENEESIKHHLQALETRKKGYGGRSQGVLIAKSLKSLIQINLDLELPKTAEKYFEELKEVERQVENKIVYYLYRLSEGLILKNKPLDEKKERAGIIFEELSKDTIIDYTLTVEALLNLADILLWKLSKSEREDILKEVKDIILNLETIASEKNSYALLAETYFLHAQLSLIELETEQTQELLTNALQIADDKGLNKLAIKISNEYDNLLDKLDRWEDFTLKLPSIAEKMELTHIEKQLNNVIKGRMTIDVVQENEQPILFFMLDHNERILYSEQFDSGLTQERIDKILIDVHKKIKKEAILGKLHRARIQELNCVIRSEFGVILCYFFIGKSYSGLKKIENLVELIENNKDVKEKVEIISCSDQSLSVNDRIKLTELLDEVLLVKNGEILSS